MGDRIKIGKFTDIDEMGPKYSRNQFGIMLKKARVEQGYSLQSLSESLGKDENGKLLVTGSYINMLERNEKIKPSIDVVLLLTKKLSLDIGEVLSCFGYERLDEEKSKPKTVLEFLGKEGIVGKLIEEEELDEEERVMLMEIVGFAVEFSLLGVFDSELEQDICIREIEEHIKRFRERRNSELIWDKSSSNLTRIFILLHKEALEKIKNLSDGNEENISVIKEKILNKINNTISSEKDKGLESKIKTKEPFIIKDEEANIIYVCKYKKEHLIEVFFIDRIDELRD